MADIIFTETAPEVVEIEQPLAYEIERNKPMPNRIHGVIQSAIANLLINLFGRNFQFPNELSLATTPSTTPDICIYAKPKQKLDPRTTEARETEMPITTIEILSPSQTIDQLQAKAWDIYFPAGVRSAWIVVPELKVIQVLTPDSEPQVFHKNTLHDPITGIEIPLEQVFEDLV